jgi:hypothetical protein
VEEEGWEVGGGVSGGGGGEEGMRQEFKDKKRDFEVTALSVVERPTRERIHRT